MQQQTAQAATDNTFLNGTVRPAQSKFISDATNYGSTENQDAAAVRAANDVRTAQTGQQTTAAQSLARMGYDPTVNAQKLAATSALGEAGASTLARERTATAGISLEGQATGVGTAVSGDAAANNAGASTNAQVAGGANSASLNAATSGAALMGAGYGTSMQGSQISGNLYGQAAGLGAQDNSGLFGALGSMGGAAISKWSSKKLKTSGAAMPDEMALEAVTAAHDAPSKPAGVSVARMGSMPAAPRSSPMTAKMLTMSNDAWKYHAGVSDGAVHVGPYAEEAQKALGNKVAPGGKKLDMVESANANSKAIAELHARVKRLTHVLSGATA